MIRIAILDKFDHVLAFMDNDAPNALHYWSDTLHEYVKGNASTFNFTCDGRHADSGKIVVGGHISFHYNNKDYYMNIMSVETSEDEVTVTTESTVFEFLNESADIYAGTNQSFEQYVNAACNGEGFVTVSGGGTSVSVLGDSYSAFKGDMIGTSVYYPRSGNDVTASSQMWYRQLRSSVVQNVSWSGSTVTGSSGSSFAARVGNLTSSADIFFIEGGLNDTWQSKPIGNDYVYSGFTDAQKDTFRGAAAYVIDTIQKKFPASLIYWICDSAVGDDYKSSLRTICSHYGIGFIEITGIAKTSNHPTKAGMTAMANQILAAVPNRFIQTSASGISDRRRTLNWDSESTVLERLYSIATGFNAEIKIEPVLNLDYTLKAVKITGVPEYDEENNRYGIGHYRDDIVLRWQKQIDSITRTVDITDFFSAIRPYATGDNNTKITLAAVADKTVKDSKGNTLYTHKKGNSTLYAPQARETVPSNSINKNDGWIVKVKSYNVKTADQLYNESLTDLKAGSVPKVTYEISGYFDTSIGDSVRVVDGGFNPELELMVRVTEQERSFTDSTQDKTTFSNAKVLQSQISSQLLAQMNELIASAIGLTVEISASNGLIFKNSEGVSTLTARVLNGGAEVTSNYTFNWYKDGVDINLHGKSFDIYAKDFNGRAVYKVEAVDKSGAVVASESVTAVDVTDGGDGAGKGIKGVPAVSYQVGTSATTAPTGTWSSTPVATTAEGQYLWTRTITTYTDNTSSTAYSISAHGAKGIKGDPGAAGADAISLVITSSAGFIFKNTDVATTLTAHVYSGGRELTGNDLSNLGTIKWYKDSGTTSIASGSTLTIAAGDVSNKASYTAQLEG